MKIKINKKLKKMCIYEIVKRTKGNGSCFASEFRFDLNFFYEFIFYKFIYTFFNFPVEYKCRESDIRHIPMTFFKKV